MKTFIKRDFQVQLFFLIAGLIAGFIGIFLDFGFMLFYFTVGIPQIISFTIKAFQKRKKSITYIFYGILILPVWFSILMVYLITNNQEVTNFFGYILISSLIYSPFLSILYVYDCYKLSKSLK